MSWFYKNRGLLTLKPVATVANSVNVSDGGVWHTQGNYYDRLQKSTAGLDLPATSITNGFGYSGIYYTAASSGAGLNYGTNSPGGKNSQIVKIWSNSSYNSRTWAPAITVLATRPWTSPYGSNWESSWWAQNSSGVNDVLVVQFATVINYTGISFGNPSESYASNHGSLAIYGVDSVTSTGVASYTLLGSGLNSTSSTLTTVTGSSNKYNIFVLRLQNVTSWNRIETIIFL